MKNRISNGVFGKIIRTLGYVLLLVSSVLILSELVLANTSYSLIAFLEPYANIVVNLVNQLGVSVVQYAFIGLVVGLLFLVWALRKGIILRLLISLLLIFVLAESVFHSNILFTGVLLTVPAFLDTAVTSVGSFIDQIISASSYVAPGAVLILVLFLWALFANKKPKRLSVNLVRTATVFLLFAVILAALPSIFTVSLFTASWYIIVTLVFYILTYALYILGGVFGVIGFGRS